MQLFLYSLSVKVLEWHFQLSEDITLAKIDYNRVEAGLHISLKQSCCILGHCEQIHTNEYHLMQLHAV